MTESIHLVEQLNHRTVEETDVARNRLACRATLSFAVLDPR